MSVFVLHPTFDLIGANKIPALAICEPASGDKRTDDLFRLARSRDFVQEKTALGIPNGNLDRF